MIDLDAHPTAPFRIVVVSRGDVARGPAVRCILRAHLRFAESDRQTAISSAGTAARPGAGVEPATSRSLAELGAVEGAEEVSAHVAHRLSERRLAQADLVLAVGRDERRRAVELRPSVRDRSFTLVEFARLVSAVPDTRGDPRGLVRQASQLRVNVRPVDPTEDDLGDLSGSDARDHERVLRRIDHAAADIGRGLATSLAGAGVHW